MEQGATQLTGVVDLGRLAAWMDEAALGVGAPITDAAPIGGGTQNILLRFRRGHDDYVLRRPPEHKRSNSDETMRREARVLAALAGTEVPHPRLIADCPDESVIGAAFYLMAPVEGINPVEAPPPAAWHRDMGFAMADSAAALGRLDHAALGLADLGRADGWLERQVERWRSQLASYAAVPGYPGNGLPGIDEIGVWLDAHRPTQWRPGLIHGDFHLGNVLFRPDGPTLAAVVDWELATVGDPLLDLGHLLATWPRPGRPDDPAAVFAGASLPAPDEVVDRYADGSDRDLGALGWYRVLACYRLAVIVEGTYARACAGQAPEDVGHRLHAIALALVERALAHL